jgi:hypothetical protein
MSLRFLLGERLSKILQHNIESLMDEFVHARRGFVKWVI